jgi:hypothetical protein
MCSVQPAPNLEPVPLSCCWCNTEAMQLHLDEITTKVSPGAHAILILDQAGWHGAKDLSNISLLTMPPRSPELNPQKYLAIHASELAVEPRLQIFDDIVDHCC